MYHFRQTRKRYRQQYIGENAAACPFCAPDEKRVIAEFTSFYIIKNGVEYDLWEGHKVIDQHLLLIPKKHIKDLAELTDKEQLEFMRIISDYERKGYSVYARSTENPRRSVEHQHTHFIKIVGERARWLFFAEKPYMLFTIFSRKSLR